MEYSKLTITRKRTAVGSYNKVKQTFTTKSQLYQYKLVVIRWKAVAHAIVYLVNSKTL